MLKEYNYLSALKEIYYPNRRDFKERLESMMKGHFKYDRLFSKFIFITDNGDKLDTFNVASGFKLIGLIQLLLSNNSIDYWDCLIIDEPESNLHPKLQISLVKILIEMADKFKLTLYINSHSTHIIKAFETYSKKEKNE